MPVQRLEHREDVLQVVQYCIRDILRRVEPADLTDAQYHEISDEYLDNLLNQFEAAQDERDNLDVEYSVGPPPSFFMISLPTVELTIKLAHSPAS